MPTEISDRSWVRPTIGGVATATAPRAKAATSDLAPARDDEGEHRQVEEQVLERSGALRHDHRRDHGAFAVMPSLHRLFTAL
jgi:hypothetical protein